MSSAPSDSATGLTSDEARRRLATYGTNPIQDVVQHTISRASGKLWAPVPWMLEAAVLLQLALGEYVEASAIAFLLVFNAGLGLFQKGRAQATLEALKSRLSVTASARRDGTLTRLLHALAEDVRARGKLDLSETFIDASFSSAKKGALVSALQNAAKAQNHGNRRPPWSSCRRARGQRFAA